MKRLLTTAILLLAAVCATGRNKPVTVCSPDGRLSATLTADGVLGYSLSLDGRTLLAGCEAAMTLGDGTTVGANEKIVKTVRRTIKEHIAAPFYRQSEFDFACNEAEVRFASGFGIALRVSDEGVAYRFFSTRRDSLTIADERAVFNFADDGRCWIPYSTNAKKPFAMAYQNTYTEQKLSDGSPLPAFLPATVETASGAKVTLLESSLSSYPGMFVECREGETSLHGLFARYPASTDFYKGRMQEYVVDTEPYIARTAGTRTFPWRILAVADDDRQMPLNNMVYALAEPNRIGETEWIKGGFSAWEWWNDWGLTGVPFRAGINNDTYKYYIDFASAHGLEYVILDEGWYVPSSGDMLTTVEDIDLPMLTDYAAERGVRLILWTVFNVLDKDLEQACRKYAEMGIAGFKVDFLDRDDQTAVEMVERIAECCARHRLVLDLHGIYKPVGLNRTYPNILNYEAVFGMEEVKWSEVGRNMPLYDVTFPFIRQASGSTDYTQGALRNAARKDFKPVYSHPMSMGTRAHQVAAYVVIDSPLSMLCDAPSDYERERATTEFIASLPRTYDLTTVPSGVLGEHIVVARRAGGKWYVGGMTSWEPRTVTFPLSFLGAGTHRATLFRDGANADRSAEDYAVEELTLSADEDFTIEMASGGGFLLKIE